MVLLGCGSGTGRQSRASEPDTLPCRPPLVAPAVERLRLLFPDYRVTREFAEPFPYLAVCDRNERLLGFQVLSDHAGTTAEGFIGPVPVRVFLNATARVLGFDVLENEETPAYLKLALCNSLADELRQYRPGRKDSIDAVTLATATSNAIIQAVTGVADRVAGKLVRPRGP